MARNISSEPVTVGIVSKVAPRLAKWLLFDLVFGLLPILARVGIDILRKNPNLSFTEVVANGELALVSAVLMAGCAGELFLMEAPQALPKIARMICGCACIGSIVGASMYFALVKTGMTTPDWESLNCVLFGGVVISGALMTTMAEAEVGDR
jgi:hypothetical protein